MLSRRSLLRTAALALPGAVGIRPGQLIAADKTIVSDRFPGLFPLQRNPDNLEFPFRELTASDWRTPNELFYVRSHFNVPKLRGEDWSLRIEGHVEHPFEIGLKELQALAPTTLTALLECAGNGRVYLSPLQAGLRWEQGGVSNADWTGV